jgi:hypothetical protein
MATPFKLKSSGPFKRMGSSPARQKKELISKQDLPKTNVKEVKMQKYFGPKLISKQDLPKTNVKEVKMQKYLGKKLISNKGKK